MLSMMEETNSKFGICPYLGQRTDPETALSYPSALNCCTHARLVVAIDLGHQEEFCLTNGYPNCEVYNAKPGAPLPAGFRYSQGRQSHKGHRGRIWVGSILLIVLLAIGAWIFTLRGGGFGKPYEAPITTVEIQEIVPSITNTALAPEVIPTFLPTPVITVTSRPLLELDTPLGIDHRFIIVQVLVGDSLERIANKHGTTVVALQAINYRIPSPLVPGWALVIPIDSVDMQELPSFEVYPVAEEISIKALAVLLSVDLNEFKYYNALDDDFIPQPGDWLLVPRVEPPISLSTPSPTP
jgi:LysM repeat protein